MGDRVHARPNKVLAAYRHCEEVTRAEAKNFSYGLRLLPGSKRQAMSAIYALARRVDDIGDGNLEPVRKTELLAQVGSMVDALAAGRMEDDETDPVWIALADAAQRFPIPLEVFQELITGVTMDVEQAEYKSFEDLLVYCRCVAGSIGRLSLGVFGCTDAERGREYADTLGLALQITNILRDVREDATMGRRYLPAEDVARFDCDEAWFATGLVPSDADFDALVRHEASRARTLFDEGLRLLPLLDRRSRACVGAMAGIYRNLLDTLDGEPAAVLAGRVSLTAGVKTRVALAALLGRVR
ncbi:presqualene diphosphate synthase HpnD [Streptomyces sp. VRA16 Mangrove soil]|uniref:presqualene diphosphate synthase HpnD n=1 Tax=Streptomyces sp. VRA16 Mangrove soil TaxID=2817434 RepID=UPI001A9DF2DC|nr:presqualene diphosphate synthase HpnD [Streptomyces sp. VRA16 Mangrove soil]MBO1334343.1 presqualene diphosphate synthase HpnD [Streptomyces sp. VRA16 Mangrove soil]